MRNTLRIGIGFLLVATAALACGRKEKAEPAATGAATESGPAAGAGAAGAGADSGAVPGAQFGAPGTTLDPAAARPAAEIAADSAAAGDAGVAAAGAAGAGAAATAKGTVPGVPAVITPADVDAYRRGQKGELERVEKIITDLGTTTDEAEKKALLEQLNDRMASLEHGAQVSGMSSARYLAVSATIEDMIVRRRRADFVTRMGVDTTRIAGLPPERQAKIRAAIAAAETPYAGLPPATVAAVSPRVAELDSLHVITGSLVGQALRAANAPPDTAGGGGGGGGGGHP